MNNGTMRFDPSPATISQNKSPEAEVTEPPTGKKNKILFHWEKFLLLPFLFPYLHNINKITIFALRRCMKSCTTQNLRKDHGRSRI